MKFHLLKKKSLFVKPIFSIFYQVKVLLFYTVLSTNSVVESHFTEVVSGLENSVHREFYIDTIPLHRTSFRFIEMKDKHRWGREELKDKNISINNEAFLKQPHIVNLTALSSHVCEIPNCSCMDWLFFVITGMNAIFFSENTKENHV